MAITNQHQRNRERGVPPRSLPDPTDTKQLRSEFKREFNTRLRRIRGDMRETVLENDAFRIAGRERSDERTQDDLAPALSDYIGGLNTNALDTNDEPITGPRPRDLRTVEDAARLDRLDEWLEVVFEDRLITPMGRVRIRRGEHYTADYLNRAYMHGDRLAIRDLKHAAFDVDVDPPSDVLFDASRKPVLREEYTAIYRDLKYLADDLRKQITRRAEDVLAGEVTKQEFYETVRERIDTIAGNRLAQIVDVRVVETVNKAILSRADQTSGVNHLTLQVEQVTGQSEHTEDSDSGGDSGTAATPGPGTDDPDATGESDNPLDRDQEDLPEIPTHDDDDAPVYLRETAGDEDVCELCAPHGGLGREIEALVGGEEDMPPLHPHCRCRLIMRPASEL